jgi:Tfp pilus assembly protein PilX
MRHGRHNRGHRGAALVSVVAILLIVAAFAGVFLSVHTAQISTEEAGIHRLRAQAAAQAATQLALWQLQNDADLLDAVARVVHEGDTSFAADPLITVTGDLAGATFGTDLWPGPDTVRLRSTGVSGGTYYTRWAQMSIDSGATFGNEQVESTGLRWLGSEQLAMQAALFEDGTVVSISAHVKGPSPKMLRFAIYSDAAGEPDALIVESATGVVGSNSYYWHTMDITPTHLTTGTYWLALSFNHDGVYCVQSGVGEGQLRQKSHDAVGGGFLASWGASDDSNTRQISIYGTYVPD